MGILNTIKNNISNYLEKKITQNLIIEDAMEHVSINPKTGYVDGFGCLPPKDFYETKENTTNLKM